MTAEHPRTTALHHHALLAVALVTACGDDVVDPTSSGTSTSSGTTADASTSSPTTTSPTTSGSSETSGATESASGTTTGTTESPTSEGSTDATTAVTATTSSSTGESASTTTGETTSTTGSSSDDTTGDVCDGPDGDGDGVPDECDLCLLGDDALDGDADTVPDACDICPDDSPDDSDGDGVCDSDDVCPEGDDNIDLDLDGIPDACDDDVNAEVMGPLYDFDSADDGTLVLSNYSNGAVFVTCYNPDLSVRKATFQVGTYDLEPAPGPGPTVDIARTSQKTIVVWHDPSGVNVLPRMKYTYLDSACNVLVPEAVAIQDPGIDYMEYHSTAIDAQGNAVIAVSRTSTGIAFIASDGALTSEQIAFNLGGIYGTHVAMNQSTGEGIVSAQPHSGGTLYYRRFNADGTWKDPAVVPVAINYHAWYDGHTVGMNDKGQFVLLWSSSSTQLDFRMFAADGTTLADVTRPTPDVDGGTPFDAYRRRHSEIQLRGDNFVLGETYRSDAPQVMHFEYTPAGALVTEDSTPISVAMVLAIRVTPQGRTYLHDGQSVTLLSNYP